MMHWLTMVNPTAGEFGSHNPHEEANGGHQDNPRRRGERHKAAQAWVNAALRSDSSLFTPSEPIWSARWLRELRERFLDKPDTSKRRFLEKLRDQMDRLTHHVHILEMNGDSYRLRHSRQSAAYQVSDEPEDS